MAHTSSNLASPFEPSANLTNTTFQKTQWGQNSARGGHNRGWGQSSPFSSCSNSITWFTQPNNTNRPICQVCTKPRHVALQCYHCFTMFINLSPLHLSQLTLPQAHPHPTPLGTQTVPQSITSPMTFSTLTYRWNHTPNKSKFKWVTVLDCPYITLVTPLNFVILPFC